MASSQQSEQRDYFRVSANKGKRPDGNPTHLAQVKNRDLAKALETNEPTVSAQLYKSEVRNLSDTIPSPGNVSVKHIQSQIETVYQEQRSDFANFIRNASIIALWEIGLVIGGNLILDQMLTSEGGSSKDAVKIHALMLIAIFVGKFHGKRHIRPIAITDTASIYHQIDPPLVEALTRGEE